MSCCEEANGIVRSPGTGCCGTNCKTESSGCPSSTSRILSCHCQSNVGCLDRNDCGGFRPSGTAATGACPGPCQCVEEEIWNSNVPPKPNCEWLSNFSELRRQWSDHARQQNCKCCNCRPCRTAIPCQPCLPTTFRTCGFVGASSHCQDYRENHRLAGGASDKRELSPAESTSSRDSRNVQREAGGGCPSVGDGRSCQTTRCRSPSTERSSSSSWNQSSAFRPSAPCRASTNCQPCAPSPKSILKKRDCCQCINGYCMCQPMPRNCKCPPPIQVDARAERDCTCDCPSSPECACPPSERRFPKSMVKCPNARLCCPLPRLPPGPKCHCVQCQPCLPAPCDPCTSTICRPAFPTANPCRSMSPCSLYSPCRPRSPDLNPPPSRTGRSTSPCCKMREQSCNERSSCRDDTLNACTRASNDRPSSAITCGRRTGQSPTIRRRRAGGDDPREEGNATKDEGESTNTNDRNRASQSPFEANSIDDVCLPRYRKTIVCETERKREGGCSRKVDTVDCRRRIDSSDKIRSDGAFNHTSTSSSISSPAYQRRDESNPERYDFARDYDSNLGSGFDNNACHRFDRDSVQASPSLQHVQDRSQCRCGRNEIGCDPSCDYCCSFGAVSFKEESRCRCGPNKNGCDKRCGYCCALSDSNGVLAETDERWDNLNVISSDDNRDVQCIAFDGHVRFCARLFEIVLYFYLFVSVSHQRANVTRGVVGPVGGDSTTTVTWSTCTQTCRCGRKSSNVFSYIGAIGHSALSPGPLTLLCFVLLIVLAITCTSGLTLYHRYFFPKKLCLRHSGR